MNFFEHQDVARRNTRLLTLLFLLAVLVLVLLTNVLVASFLWMAEDYNVYSGSKQGLRGFWDHFRWNRFGTISLAILAAVALVVMVKWIQLSSGGKVVAESMGGSRVLPQTDDPAERRVLNVVQELALAANMPVPPVYVLNSERGINAFAAGITTADAVVAVTRGAIVQFKRHELQGVIAHEFSHILNGDMRLNIRLAAMLKGITFIGDVGHFLTRMRSRRAGGRGANNAALPVLGIGLMLVGGLGGVAAGFIKAAISRQKEYLADASAVQFTRNPDDIGDALKVIGGYVPGTLVHAGRAIDMSHIFFGQIQHRLWQVFATHPPLNSRIIRVDPQWDGQYISRKIDHGEIEKPVRGVDRDAIVAAAILASAVLSEAQQAGRSSAEEEDADFAPHAIDFDAVAAKRHELPLAFVQHSHQPMGAQALAYALLLSQIEGVSQRQIAMIEDLKTLSLSTLVYTLAPAVQRLASPLRLPLLEMCMPALKSISLPQYREFKDTLLRIIRADKKTELYEWCVFQLIQHYLDPEFIRVRRSRPRYRKLAKVTYHLRTVLSVLAHEGSGEAQTVFRLAADHLDFSDLQILPQSQCSVAAFSRAVTELADCYPLLKPRVLKAMAFAAGSDGQLTGMEQEIIASIAAVMDCPVPPPMLANERQ
ncbi:MAG: Zn-dependent protease with chaperone function [Halioglobus sp.]|jgi:Zn-dependent protease with chaperone function